MPFCSNTTKDWVPATENSLFATRNVEGVPAHVPAMDALVVATGGHWAVLQSVAWFGMFVNFSQTAPVMVALEKTFDGRHPCKLCKVVQAGQESEKKQEMQKLETKLPYEMDGAVDGSYLQDRVQNNNPLSP